MLLLGLNSNSKNIVLNSLSNTKDRLQGGLFFVGMDKDVARLRSPNEDGGIDKDYGYEPGWQGWED